MKTEVLDDRTPEPPRTSNGACDDSDMVRTRAVCCSHRSRSAHGPKSLREEVPDPWTEFCWRVRYKWENDGPVERLRFNLTECMK